MTYSVEKDLQTFQMNMRQREEQLSRALPYVPGPFAPGGFSVNQRDVNHFDIYAERRPGYVQWYYKKNPDHLAHPMNEYAIERAFCVRGEPGNIYVRDERWDNGSYLKDHPRDVLKFPSVESAMAWIVATLLINPKKET